MFLTSMIADDHPLSFYLSEQQGIRPSNIAGAALQLPLAHHKVIFRRQLLHALDSGYKPACMCCIRVCFFITFHGGFVAISGSYGPYKQQAVAFPIPFHIAVNIAFIPFSYLCRQHINYSLPILVLGKDRAEAQERNKDAAECLYHSE